MREPLFRGVSKETNEWVYGFGWFKTDYTEEYLKALGKIEQDAVLYTNSGPVLCYLDSMGEWTGLRDNKKTDEFPDGQMIFEGDIVKSATQNNIVEFKYGSFKILGLHEDKYQRTYSDLYHFLIDATLPDLGYSKFDGVTTTLEVVGNIYEDKHLLEGAFE